IGVARQAAAPAGARGLTRQSLVASEDRARPPREVCRQRSIQRQRCRQVLTVVSSTGYVRNSCDALQFSWLRPFFYGRSGRSLPSASLASPQVQSGRGLELVLRGMEPAVPLTSV